MLFSGQGKVYSGKRNASGVVQALRFLGEVSALEADPKTSTTTHNENTTGQRLEDNRLITGKSCDVKITLDEWDIDNLALALYGSATSVAGASVTAEALPDGLVAGDYFRFKYPGVSSVVMKDSAGSPTTLVLGTDYEITSADHGTGKLINVGAYTQPFTLDYDYAGGENVAMFDTPPAELWLKFDGLNTADGDAAVLVELYRCFLDPVGALTLINSTDYGKLQLQGSALYDSVRAADTMLGRFGRVIQVAAA